MEITVPMRVEDVKALQKYSVFKSLIIMFCSSLVIVGYGIFEIVLYDLGMGIFFLVFGVVFPVVSSMAIWFAMNKATKPENFNDKTVNKYNFADEEVQIVTLIEDKEISKASLNYKNIHKVVVTNKHIFVFINSRQAFIIAKSLIKTHEIVLILELLKTKVVKFVSKVKNK